ncbi:hypothetical protein FEM03_03335 [Phragmitibacter flavus]|uniref:Probable sensor domain-containing protein n=2 Tax=Phragmitibacter flavus TaxID=2576071 RepID=A0A5R8KJJ4_9BACT|nr:hypothetical protein FEM03_03335 [Phragmitibacter flavus]
MRGLVVELEGLLAGRADSPTKAQLMDLCDLLYASSLLKEEGRAVRARLVVAPPDAFAVEDGPPEGVHAIRFAVPHPLTSNEVKRLSPAASFYHSVIAVWPDKGRGFRVWGILNTGPRWMNLVAGGRKVAGADLAYPIIHVRDPGWLLFYQDYRLLAEWRGREFHGPRMDVFQSKLLSERFADLRRQLVEELRDDCLPETLSLEAYADLAHLIALQFVRRSINLVRTSGHGGSLVLIPDDEEGRVAAEKWIDCKYLLKEDGAGQRFRQLWQAIIRRVGQLSPAGASVEQAWQVFRLSRDEELDQLEESFFELARLLSDFMMVDGALVLDHRLGLVGFGGEIRVDRTVLYVEQAHDLEGGSVSRWDVQGDGTRHRAVYRLCSVEPSVIGFVVSQDSQVRMIANVYDSVMFWPHTVI